MFNSMKAIFSVLGLLVLPLVGFSEANAKGVLIQQRHLHYEGAFRVPKGALRKADKGYATLGYGGEALTYNPTRNSLIIIGHPEIKLLVEISIPEIVISMKISDLKTANVLQPPVNITNGNWNKLRIDGASVPNGGRPGGFLFYRDKLIGSAYASYDGPSEAVLSHFIASPNWSETGTQFRGMYQVKSIDRAGSGGFVGGYMAHIPQEWQSDLGGVALTGIGALAVVSRTSLGPCANVFNPDDIGVVNPVPATMLVGYPQGHETLGKWSGPSLYYNAATEVRGLVFPAGSASLLFFGKHGLGPNGDGKACYGAGTTNPKLHETLDEHKVKYCYDPSNSNKGVHAYPYVYRVWAYDANDLVKVKSGAINPKTNKPYKPWDIIPYGIWNLRFPFAVGISSILGVAYDPKTQRVFISQQAGDKVGDERYPLIQVFRLSL